MKDVIVIGAGIAGLTAAYHLYKAGLEVLVVESSTRVGGAICSGVTQDGYLLEWGPNSAIARPSLLKLIDELQLGAEILFPSPEAKRRYFASAKTDSLKLHTVPMSFREAILSPILSPAQKLRVLFEPFIQKQHLEDESVASFFSRRFGKGFFENIIAPFFTGIWAADLSVLSARSAMEKLWAFEQTSGSVIKGALKTRRKNSGSDSNHKKSPYSIVSFQNGMETLPNSLAQALPEHCLKLGTKVTALSPSASSATVFFESGEPIQARHVLITSSAGNSADLIQSFSPSLATSIRSVPVAPIGILHATLPKNAVKHPLDGFGFLVPPTRGTALLGAIFSSSLFQNRAPKDMTLLTCFAGGAIRPHFADVTQVATKEQVLQELSAYLSCKEQPKVVSTRFISHAIAQFPLFHFRTQQAIADFEDQTPCVRILASWCSGLSVPDRVDAAIKAAEDLLRTHFSEQAPHQGSRP